MSNADKPVAIGTFVEKTERNYREETARTSSRPDEAEDIEASEAEENRRVDRDGETYRDPKSL